MQPLGQKKGLDGLYQEYALLLKPGYQHGGDRAERRAQLERFFEHIDHPQRSTSGPNLFEAFKLIRPDGKTRESALQAVAPLRLNGAQLVNRLIPAAAVQLGQLVSLRRLAPLGFQLRRSSCACRSASSARCVLSVLSSTCTRTRQDACAPSNSARAACAAGAAPAPAPAP